MSKQQIEQLQADINALQKQLDELRNPQPKPLEMWKPNKEPSYQIHDTGDIVAYSAQCNYSDYLLDCHNIGNCFPTRELAEYFAARRAARQRLEMLALAERFSAGENQPYEFAFGRGNWVIFADRDEISLGCGTGGIREDPQYFPTRAAAQRVLDAMTDSDLILLYGTANRGGK